MLANHTTGCGWYTHHENLELLFLPELVELIVSDEYQKGKLLPNNLVEHLLVKLGVYSPDLSCYDLEVVWVDSNTQFRIDRDYDPEYGYDSEVIVVNDGNWITA